MLIYYIAANKKNEVINSFYSTEKNHFFLQEEEAKEYANGKPIYKSSMIALLHELYFNQKSIQWGKFPACFNDRKTEIYCIALQYYNQQSWESVLIELNKLLQQKDSLVALEKEILFLQLMALNQFLQEKKTIEFPAEYLTVVQHLNEYYSLEELDFMLLYQVGIANYTLNNYEKAAQCFLGCLELFPRNINSIYALAETYLQLNSYEKAEQYFLKGLDIAPLQSEILTGLVELYKAQGKVEQETQILKVLQSTGSHSHHFFSEEEKKVKNVEQTKNTLG